MKEKKKDLLGALKKRLDGNDVVENQVIKLALKKLDGARDDGWGVYYTKSGRRLVAAKKTIEGSYAVKDDTQEIWDQIILLCF